MRTPPIRPRLARLRRDADGIVPAIETTSFCPIKSWSEGAAAEGPGPAATSAAQARTPTRSLGGTP
jgi:hypothetical protein